MYHNEDESVDNVTDANIATCTVTDAMIEEMNADLLETYRAIDAQMDDDSEEWRAEYETTIIEFTDAA